MDESKLETLFLAIFFFFFDMMFVMGEVHNEMNEKAIME